MSEAEFFLKFFLVLVSAKAMGELFAQLKLPAVIGEIIAGLIIGPSLLGLVQPEPTFMLLARIGMLLLLFEVGVDTDVGQLLAVGGQSVLVALTGVALPFAFGYLLSVAFGFGSSTSLFIGGTMVATSIGITLRVLKDLGAQHSRPAQVVLGAAVLDDVIGVVILAVLFDYTVEGRIDVVSSVTILVFIAVFLIAAPVLSRLLVTFMARVSALAKTPGMLSTIVVSLILILAVTAHDFGAPEIVGAFAAGLALSRKSIFNMGRYVEHMRSEIVGKAEEKMTSIGELFIPVFFVMVGVSIDFRLVDYGSLWFWGFAGAMLAAAFFSKLFAGVWTKGTPAAKLTVGVAMVPRGEVGIIFAEIGHRNGLFDDSVYASMVFVVALTTLIAPVLMRVLLKGPEAAPA